jgi:uncharacterized protein YjbJ (UPF0337 family)
MKDSTKDKAEGTAHEVKGAVKEKIGHATNDFDLEAEGAGEKAGGKFQKKLGKAEKVVEKAVEKATDGVLPRLPEREASTC